MLRCFRLFLFAAVGSAVSPWAKAADTAGKSIPFDQLGTEAQKQYQGDGIAITPTPGGARLRAAFQKLEAEATPKGLWLKSTEASTHSDRFRVLAATISREGHADSKLAATGQVIFRETEVSFVRPGLVEEYRVSMDGVRQDFVVLERPVGTGDLRVGLEVTGAAVTTASSGVKFTLAGSGREIAYGRLQVTDATGRKLAARMEVAGTRLIQICAADAGATYPIRVDPTFSDANWASMGGVAGPNGSVTAIAIGPDGKLYIGGGFTVIGQVMASHVAVWEGTSWSALDSGVIGHQTHEAAFGAPVFHKGTAVFRRGRGSRERRGVCRVAPGFVGIHRIPRLPRAISTCGDRQ
ncbi:MAG: hypothetical protein U0984_18440, partial [Prosthecobacter sp.]|nr:hypothetical protein [Prosthecobacter sp.]